MTESALEYFGEFRIPKLAASFYRSQISTNYVIEPSFYWRFDGIFSVTNLGNQCLIWSNVEQLVLFLDGSPYATLLPTKSEFQNLQFPPFIADFSNVDNTSTLTHELQIDGYVNSQPVISRKFSSDLSMLKFQLAADTTQLNADGMDTTRVTFLVLDEYNNIQPDTVGPVKFQVTGPAIFFGESTFPMSSGAFWLRSNGTVGTVTVQANHKTLGTTSLSVEFT